MSASSKTIDQLIYPHAGYILRKPFGFPIEPVPLYRGDAREFSEIFKNGFHARGTNTNFLLHARPPNGADYFVDSAFVSASESKEAAISFPKNTEYENLYVYEIRSTKPTVNAETQLLFENIQSESYKLLLEEKERAFPLKIEPNEISGYWKAKQFNIKVANAAELLDLIKYNPKLLPVFCDEYIRCIEGTFIPDSNYNIRYFEGSFKPNPNYPPYKWFKRIQFAGLGLTGVGLAIDSASLYNEYQHSKKMGNFTNTKRELSRLGGGWTGAFLGGWAGAKTGAAAGSLCGGLVGSAIGGLGGGIFGSAVGYYEGSSAATQLYDASKNQRIKIHYNHSEHNQIKARSIYPMFSPSDLTQAGIVTKTKITEEADQLFQKHYGISLDKKDPVICNQIYLHYGNYKSEQERVQKLKDKEAQFTQGYQNTKQFFGEIEKIGMKNGDIELSKMGSIVGSIASITWNALLATGGIPGVAAPIGFGGMFLPVAGIAAAGFSILTTLLCDDNDSLNDKFITIANMITELRKILLEFIQQSTGLQKTILTKLLLGLDHLEKVLRSDNKQMKASIVESCKKLTNEINFLRRLSTQGFAEVRLDRFQELTNLLESYRKGNLVQHYEAKEVARTLEKLETNWLLGNLSSNMFNSGWYYELNEKSPKEAFQQIANMTEDVLNHDVEFILGFLGKFAKKTLEIASVPDELPHLELFRQGVKQSLAARSFLIEQRETFDAKGEQLQKIKRIATNTIQFVDTLEQSRGVLFEKLLKMYTDGLKALEDEAIKSLIEKNTAALAGKNCALAEIPLPPIQHATDEKEYHALDSKIFTKELNEIELPRVLAEAQCWGLNILSSTYHTGTCGNLSNEGNRQAVRRMNREFGNRDQIRGTVYHYADLKIKSIKIISDVTFHCSVSIDNANCRIPVKELCQSHWTSSTKASEAKLDAKALAETTEKLSPYLTEEIVKRKWAAAKAGNANALTEIKEYLSDKDLRFLDPENQLKASRGLIIAYCRLLSFSEKEVLPEISRLLKTSHLEFFNDPSLFDIQQKVAIPALQRLFVPTLKQNNLDEKYDMKSSSSPLNSSVKVKAKMLIDHIDNFDINILKNNISSAPPLIRQVESPNQTPVNVFHHLNAIATGDFTKLSMDDLFRLKKMLRGLQEKADEAQSQLYHSASNSRFGLFGDSKKEFSSGSTLTPASSFSL